MAEKETFADVVREVVGDRPFREVADVGGISHTYLNDWGRNAIPRLRRLVDFANNLQAKGWLSSSLRERLFRAAGYVDPGPPEDLAQQVAEREQREADLTEQVIARLLERVNLQSPAEVLLEGWHQLCLQHPDLDIPMPILQGGVRKLTLEGAQQLLAVIEDRIARGGYPRK